MVSDRCRPGIRPAVWRMHERCRCDADQQPKGTAQAMQTVHTGTLPLARVDSSASPGLREFVIRQGARILRKPDALTIQATAPVNSATSVVTLVTPVAPASGTPGTRPI